MTVAQGITFPTYAFLAAGYGADIYINTSLATYNDDSAK